MTLSRILKNVFTSGDCFTVLQLINKLIEAVETYEAEGGVESLPYKCRTIEHTLTGEEVALHSLPIEFGCRVATYMPIVIYRSYRVPGIPPRFVSEIFEVFMKNISLSNTSLGACLLGKDENDYLELAGLSESISAGTTFKIVFFEDVDKIGGIFDV